jgi:hypothetical protein
MLDHLAEQRLAGCCDSKDEMLQKTRQLLSKDGKLRDAIRKSQAKIIEKFSTALVRDEWAKTLAECSSVSDAMSIRSI